MTAKKKTLTDIGDLSSLLDNNQAASDGKPLALPMDKIHHDPNNRSDVSQEFLEELAADIKERGVKAPISVKVHPEPTLAEAGHYMINDGHQRHKGASIAGLDTIPGFIDNNFDDFDQQKANLLKATQSARDNARFVGRKLKEGVAKGEIAKRLGKSAAWVSQHVALLNLPENLDFVFNHRCDDVTVINELLKLHKKHPEEVDAFLADTTQDINRGSVKLLAEFIETKDAEEQTEEGGDGQDETTSEKPQKDKKESDPTKLKKAIVIIEYMGQSGQLDMKKRPSSTDNGWIKLDSDGEEVEVPLAQLKILELIEG